MRIEIEVDGDFMGGHLVYNRWDGSQFTITHWRPMVSAPIKEG